MNPGVSGASSSELLQQLFAVARGER